MASSIHIRKATAGSVAHNSRETHSYSVVFPDEKNECSHSSKEAFKEYRQELAIRAKAYQDRTHQKLQKNAITHLSAVVNLEQHHTLKDLETIKKYIEKKFDTKVFQMSIHRDEGKLVSKEDEKLVYTSGEDFFMDTKTQELFWDKKFTKKVDMSQYDIVKNYHAHIEFLGLDSKGEAIKRNYMSKYNLSQLQTFVAKELGMERGKNYYETKEKAPKRLDVLEFKRANTSKRENTQELIKVLEDKYKKEREELKASGAATQKDYQALKVSFEKQKKELEHAKSSVETYKTLYDKAAQSRDFYKERGEKVVEREVIVEKIIKVEDTAKIEELKKDLSQALEAKKEVEAVNHTLRSEKMDLRASQSVLIAENEELKSKSKNSEIYKSALMKIAPEATSAKETVAFVESLKQENKSLKEKLEPLVKFFERINKSLTEQAKAKFAELFPTLYPKQPSLETAVEKVKENLDKLQHMQSNQVDLKSLQEFMDTSTVQEPTAKIAEFVKQAKSSKGLER